MVIDETLQELIRAKGGVYSLQQAIRSVMMDGRLQPGVERLFDESLRKAYPGLNLRQDGFYAPLSIVSSRALNAGTATASFAIGAQVENIISALRPKSVVLSSGAQVFYNLTGNLQLPRWTNSATGTWVSETEECGTSDLSMGVRNFAPRRIASSAVYSFQLANQSGEGVEDFMRRELAAGIATAIDQGALAGTGVGGEPLGILNDPDVRRDVTFSGAADWADVLDFESYLSLVDADDAACRFVMSPETRRKWKAKERAAGSGFLMEGSTVNGYPTAATTHLSDDNRVIFGDFRDFAVAFWSDVIHIVVDKFTLAKSGQVQLIAQSLADCGVRRGGSFQVSVDAANQ